MSKSASTVHRKKKTGDLPFSFYNLVPKQACHKCGQRLWSAEAVNLTWSCAVCGNLIYYTYGALKQQIDLVMQSDRGKDYVYSTDGRCILPKKNEELRRIRFCKQMKRK